MAIFPRIKTWVSNEILTANDLNTEFNNILNHFNSASVEGYSHNVSEMQFATDPYPASTESLASDVAGELQRIRFALRKISGTTQWYIPPASTFATGGIQTAALADASVTTPKVADGSITPVKRAALGQQLSTSSGAFSTASTTPADATNLTVTITTTGRPVWLGIISDGGGSESYWSVTGVGVSFLYFVRATTIIATYRNSQNTTVTTSTSTTTAITHNAGQQNNASLAAVITAASTSTSTNTLALNVQYLPSSMFTIDPVAAGTYTYKIQLAIGGGAVGTSLSNAKLMAFEL